MDLPNNYIGIGALLFALGTITGLLFFAAFGMLAGTVFGILVVIMALGLLYDTAKTPDKADDETEEDEDEEPDFSLLARTLYMLIAVMTMAGLLWGVMFFIAFFFEVSFELKTWLLPLILALFVEGWSLYDLFICRPIYNILEQQTDGKENR